MPGPEVSIRGVVLQQSLLSYRRLLASGKFSREIESALELSGVADASLDCKQGVAHLRGLRAVEVYLNHIRDAGCFVRSVEQGLVDFPAILDGRKVYLCWRYGESDIGFWHETNAGFDDRASLG